MVSKRLEEEVLLTSDLINNVVKLINKKVVNENTKQILLHSFLEISFEHITSILLLIEKELIGSAFALIRPFYETIFRALWIQAYGDDNHINKILKKKSPYPSGKIMSEDLDNFYTKTDFFTLNYKNWWSTLCEYTHTGILPISRRWNDDGSLDLNYTDDEIIEMLSNMRKMFLLFIYVILKALELKQEMDEIIKLSEKY